jgi:MFS family permease
LHRDFAVFWLAANAGGLATQMTAVAVGWQVYAIHRSAFDLGLVGLCEFVPLLLLALPAGQLADRVSRRLLILASLTLDLAVVLLLLVVTLHGARALWPFLALAAAAGIASALGAPGLNAVTPSLVPAEILASAVALRSTAFQTATVAGPALGGLIFAASPAAVYAVAAAVVALALGAATALRVPPHDVPAESVGIASLLGGVSFIRSTPILLGAISLDLFAVLFGGAVALLPVFARSILHTGPIGLGVLRATPAVGALAASVILAHRPIGGHAGRTLLTAVGVFGAATVVFGLSRSFGLSLVMLVLVGFSDAFSVNIRATTVAVATPDELRGRVMAVEMVFISASNELGAFESGAAAALLGAVTAVVAGGIVTIGCATSSRLLFPPLAQIDRLETLRPAEVT